MKYLRKQISGTDVKDKQAIAKPGRAVESCRGSHDGIVVLFYDGSTIITKDDVELIEAPTHMVRVRLRGIEGGMEPLVFEELTSSLDSAAVIACSCALGYVERGIHRGERVMVEIENVEARYEP